MLLQAKLFKIVVGEKTNLDLTPYSSKNLIRNFCQKIGLYFLTLKTLFWSNFIIGKFATLFEVPPLTSNFSDGSWYGLY